MNSNVLYNDIVVLLYNFLKISKLRKKLKVDEIYKEDILKLINNLLFLENDYNCTINDEKYALTFARVVVNILNNEEQIEKPDFLTLSKINEDYNNLIFKINENYPDIKFSNQLIMNKNISKKKIIELTLFDESKENKNENIDSNKDSFTSNDFNDNVNNFNNVDPNNVNIMANAHPMTNPKFYPYKTKPKWMPLFKKILFFILLITIGLTIAISIYGSIYPYKLSIDYTENGNGYVYPPADGSEKSSISQSFAGSPITTLIDALMGFVLIMFGVFVFGKKNAKREVYRINPFYSIISILVLIFIIYLNLSFVLNKSFYNIYISTWIKTYAWTPGSSDAINNWIKTQSDLIMHKQEFQIIKIASILSIFFSFIVVIIFVFAIIKNPKIDTEKIKRANVEYQKFIQAKFKGQNYKIDPTLFDDDLDNDNDNKNNNNDNNSHKNDDSTLN